LYFETSKTHWGTLEPYITSCENGHNRSPLKGRGLVELVVCWNWQLW